MWGYKLALDFGAQKMIKNHGFSSERADGLNTGAVAEYGRPYSPLAAYVKKTQGPR